MKYGTPEYNEAKARIDVELRTANEALERASIIAAETGVDFYWAGPSYGMGGSYVPPPKTEESEWQSSTGSCGWTNEGEEAGWKASSMSC